MRKGCASAAAPGPCQSERATTAPAPSTAAPARSDRRLSFIAIPIARCRVRIVTVSQLGFELGRIIANLSTLQMVATQIDNV